MESQPQSCCTGTAETLPPAQEVFATGALALASRDGWSFEAPDSCGVPSSSGRKRIVSGGRFSSPGRTCAAVAVLFDCDHALEFGLECAALARFGQIGVGPELLAVAEAPRAFGQGSLCLVEEDAGVNLETALRGGATVPGVCPRPLADLSTGERRIQNQKIAFDVLCQLKALHDCGLYHRDLRPANVCLRMHGPDAADIRATLVDLEVAAGAYDGLPRAIYRPYYGRLFRHRPLGAGPAQLGDDPFAPTPLDIDMGYLSLLLYELDGGDLEGLGAGADFDRAAFLGRRAEFLPSESGEFLAMGASGVFSPRRIEMARDIEPLAESLGLQRVDDALGEWQAARRPGVAWGGFVDRAGLERIENDPAYLLAQGSLQLARLNYQVYVAGMRRRGLEVCEWFEDQPAALQESGLLSARHTLVALEQLGFYLVRCDRLEGREAVGEFSAAEVERFAMIEHGRWASERLAAGWQWGPVKDPAKKTHPCLVAYAELPEEEKDKNRAKALAAPGHLKSLGLALVRVERGGVSIGGPALGDARDALLVQMARSSFESYKAHRRRDGLPVEYERFEDQPETLRRSGIDQARGLWDKATLLGCSIVPRGEADPARVVDRLNDEEVELLAVAEHDRWVAERRSDGWVFGQVKDAERKVSPYLVPYEELAEGVKDYDRQPMRELVGRLASVGMVLVRPAR